MNDRPRPIRGAAWASMAYRWLLWLYPPTFRRRFGPWMQQAFDDLAREGAVGRQSTFWVFVVKDFGGSLMSSWRESTSGSATIWLVMAALALAPGALFFTSVILIDYLGIGALEPMRADLLGPNDSLHRTLTDGAIVMGPVAAMVLAVMPWLRGGQLLDAEGRAALLVDRGGRLALLFVGAGVLLAAIFFTYFVGENWQCLVGAAASC